MVLARTPGITGSGRSASTVVYGHLDVKPAGRGWSTPPFRPTRLGHRLQARGASDDKGKAMAHLAALAAWAAAGGPPGNVLTVLDGAEGMGSPGLGAVLSRARADVFAGPVNGVLVVDTRAAGPGRPTLTLSSEGRALGHCGAKQANHVQRMRVRDPRVAGTASCRRASAR